MFLFAVGRKWNLKVEKTKNKNISGKSDFPQEFAKMIEKTKHFPRKHPKRVYF